MTQHAKKLIEVALPLEAINVAAAKEKSIRHGHPSTLHLWWARRPLAACRAVLFAQLVDDPSAHQDEFPTPEAQAAERSRLWEIIEQLVPWQNSNNETVLAQARQEIARSVAWAHGVRLPPGADPGQVAVALARYAPPVLDPFCGGGSIPLEAQRLGLEAHASDLNPVAVLITKALIEIPPKWAGQPPVNPEARRKMGAAATWKGAAGLADDVRYYGQWMRDEAQRRIGHLYPQVTLPKEHGGGTATVIACLWARTVKCPNPACGAFMPLVRSFVLSKTSKQVWVEPQIDRLQHPPVVHFEIKTGSGKPAESPKIGRGATFKCLACGSLASDPIVRTEGLAGRMGSRLMAIVAEGHNGRIYLPPAPDHEAVAAQAQPTWKPDAPLPGNRRWFSPPVFGIMTYSDLFTPRQLVALTTFSDLVGEAREKIRHDALSAMLPNDGNGLASGGQGATAYSEAVSVYLAFVVSSLADRMSSICTWDAGGSTWGTKTRNTFARQAIPMSWDFAEVNPLSTQSGSFNNSLDYTAKGIGLAGTKAGLADQADGTAQTSTTGSIISTDPPYYDNIGYADLSDFFYVWLRRSLASVYPGLFSTLLVPKAQELVATPYRFGGSKEKAQRFFEEGLGKAFENMRASASPNYPLSVYYAFKQAESDEDGDEAGDRTSGLASTGWETMLEGLLHAGFQVTGTWPMRTELSNRPTASGTNALASSIVLVCRPRPEAAPLATRRDFLRVLKRDMPAALQVLTSGRVAPVDLAQAAIGPGMGIFSSYAKVLQPDGRPMSVRTALSAINEVIQTYFAEQENELDPATQFCLTWYKQYGTNPGPYGVALTLSTAKDIAIDRLAHDGLVKQGGGRVQLYPASAEPYGAAWDPRDERSFTIWAATHRLVAAHRRAGNPAAAEVAAALGGFAEQARTLAYGLYQIASAPGHGWTEEALGYNHLVADWPEIQKLAAAVPGRVTQLGLEM